ncbi:hypothetical protein F8S09_13385 [Deinococcus sp. SDU3-2]|uniref:Core-binding (CB) domain-containing protein n=1 Tax=Deinococcus terrestris TaxID=2651870 RepID=A0A7X1NYG4_9DEIO|nr:hypothetical protein [Deinococcus terrestris]MPY67664.1 hypothetical protein [Deinococcus terrestris]
MPHPQDERAAQLARAMMHADLDALLGLTRHLWSRPSRNVYTLLKPIFEAAEASGLSLLRPPPPADFHPWLLQAAARPGVTGVPVRPNTVRTRLGLLARLYDHLIDEGLITTGHPMRGLQRPPAEASQRPLPSSEHVRTVLSLTDTPEHLPLHVALTLIYHHAFQVTELLTLTWGAYEPRDGTLLRRRAVTRLDREAHHALNRLYARAGAAFAPEHERLFPYTNHDTLRKGIFQATWGHAPFISPADLRKASLRDFPHTLESAGFTPGSQQQFQRAITLARASLSHAPPRDS